MGDVAFRRKEAEPKGADVDEWDMCVAVGSLFGWEVSFTVFPVKQWVRSQQLRVRISRRGWSLEEKGRRRAGRRNAQET